MADTPTTPRRAGGSASAMTPPPGSRGSGSEDRSAGAGSSRLLTPRASVVRQSSSDSRLSGASGVRRPREEASTPTTPIKNEGGGLPNPISALGGFIKSYSPVALLVGSGGSASSTEQQSKGASPSGSPTLGKWNKRSASSSPKVTISRPLHGAPISGSSPPAQPNAALPDRSRMGREDLSVSLPGTYFSPGMATTPSRLASPLVSPDPNANRKDQAGMGFPRRRVVSDGSKPAREGDDDDDGGGGIPGIGALLNGLPSLNLNLNWSIGNILGLGADGSQADKERLAAAAAQQDLRQSVDLRLDEAASGGRSFGDETPMSLTPLGQPRPSSEMFPRTSSSADTEPVPTEPAAGKPPAQRPVLFNLQTPFSTSSSAVPQLHSARSDPSPIQTDPARRGSGPLSPAVLRAGAQVGFDPLTLHALAREQSETDVLRALRERDERLGALTRVLEEEEPLNDPGSASSFGPSPGSPGQARSAFGSATPVGAGARSSMDALGIRPLRPQQHGRAASTQAVMRVSERKEDDTPSQPGAGPVAEAREKESGSKREGGGQKRPATAPFPGPPLKLKPKLSMSSLNSEAASDQPKPKKTILSKLGLGGGSGSRTPSSGMGPRPKRSSTMTSSASTSSLAAPPSSNGASSTLVGSASASSLHNVGAAGGKGTRYIRVKTRNKEQKEFKNLFVSQELSTCPGQNHAPSPTASSRPSFKATVSTEDGRSVASGSSDEQAPPTTEGGHGPGPSSGHASDPKRRAVWALKFSCDGSHLAAGCQDGIVRVWAVLRADEDRHRALIDGLAANAADFDLDAIPAVPISAPAAATSHSCPTQSKKEQGKRLFHMPVFEQRPVREFVGHTADVLDVSWSKNGFLLSSSMDKTVRLWHVSKPECLVVFEHSDFITAVSFHPKDDRFFISGSLDCKLRLWNIVEKRVHSWTELPDLITSVVFTADGKLAAAGTYAGTVLFFECETLKYVTTLHAKSSRGKNAKGRKITAVIPVPGRQQERVLVTSNDSRIRMYNLAEKSMVAKYKGLANATSQIRASMSDDSSFVISGSEDRHIYIWDSGLDERDTGLWHAKKNQGGMESFLGQSNIITCAVFAPLQTRCILSQAKDPIYRDAPGLLGVYETTTSEPVVTPLNHLRWEGPEVTRVSDGRSSADGAIIVAADDHTGTIRVYRNSSLAAFADQTGNGATPSRRGSAVNSVKHSPAPSRRGSMAR